MRRVVAELTRLSRLLTDLYVPPTLPIPLRSDSHAAIYIAKTPVFYERMKHIELDCHFGCHQFQSGLIYLSFLPTHSQLEDIFTKPLSGPSHCELLSK